MTGWITRLVLLVVMTVTSAQPALANSATTVTSHASIDFSGQVLFPSCGDEPVVLEGTAKSVTHITLGDGGFFFMAHFTFQGVKATGTVSGQRYVVSVNNSFEDKVSFVGAAQTTNYVNTIRFVALGNAEAADWLHHLQSTYTLTPSGEWTASMHFFTECR